MPAAALLTIQSGGNKPPLCDADGDQEEAKTKENEKPSRLAGLCGAHRRLRVERVYLPEKQKRTEMIDGHACGDCGGSWSRS